MKSATIMDLCALFDRYEIAETQSYIDREYYTVKETIFTDGEYDSHVTRDAYIKITSVRNANYLIFIDIEHKIYLCAYKYMPKTKYKFIKQKLQILKSMIAEEVEIDIHHHHYPNTDIIDEKDINKHNVFIDDNVVNINEFICTECGSGEKMSFSRSKTNPDALITKCNVCKTEYTFVPSKYYKLSSKKTIYFKSEKSSRQIEIINNNDKKCLPGKNIESDNSTTQQKEKVDEKQNK